MESLATAYAPAERATPQETDRQHHKLATSPVVGSLLDSFPEAAVLLNQQRQIVFANDKLAALLGCPRDSLLGRRHGEALNCIHVAAAPGGCGTTRFCRHCGAVNATLNTQRSGAPDVQECRIQQKATAGTTALDLRVWTTPMTFDGEPFVVFAIRDTTDEKRRQVLERIFFHDTLNVVGGLRTVLEMLLRPGGDTRSELIEVAREYADDLVEVIQSQRDLAAAERGDLEVRAEVLSASDVLHRLQAIYSRHSVAEGKRLVVDATASDDAFISDKWLLLRVLGNLTTNALEASEPGHTVTLSYQNGDGPTFHVHNQTAITDAVQAQVFQRSFSTKGGSGRGVGTYSVKLLTERYLEGTVAFRSSAAEGTTFTIRLPRAPQPT